MIACDRFGLSLESGMYQNCEFCDGTGVSVGSKLGFRIELCLECVSRQLMVIWQSPVPSASLA